MPRCYSRIFVCVLFLVYLFVLPCLAGDSILSQKEKELLGVFEHMDMIQGQLDDIEKRLEVVVEELEKLEEDYRQITEESRQVEEELQSTCEEISDMEKMLKEKQERVDELSARLDTELQNFNSYLRRVYMSGFTGYFQFFVNSQDLEDFFNRLTLLQRIIKTDSELIETLQYTYECLKTETADLERELENLADKQKRLVVLQETLKRNYDRLEEVISSKEQLSSKLEKERARHEEVLEELMESSGRLEMVISSLQGEPIPDSSRGSTNDFIWPLDGYISSDFGWRTHPILQTRKLHTGIDIAVNRGTPVMTVAAGKVIFSGWVNGYGNTVIIDHGSSIMTLYAHNDKLVCRAGVNVKKGDVIAYSGNTGNSTGPHLHFEVRKNGSSVNPLDWLP